MTLPDVYVGAKNSTGFPNTCWKIRHVKLNQLPKQWASHGQAQNGVNFDFEVKFDLEGQGQSPPPPPKKKNNRDLNQGLLHLWSKFGDPSLNGAQSHRADKQVIDAQTDTHTQTQAMTIPKGQNWPRVKKKS